MPTVKKSPPIQFADVAILASSIRTSVSAYTYRCQKSVRVGDLVLVPFGKRMARGIVIALSKNTPLSIHTIRSITTVIIPNAISKSQQKLAQFLSEESLVPIHVALRKFIPPEKPKRIITKKSTLISRKKYFSQTAKNIADTILAKSSSALLLMNTKTNRLDAILATSQQIIQNGGQVLILFPDHISLDSAVSRAKSFFSIETIAVLHGSTSRGKKYEIYQRLSKKKSPTLVLGLASALFAPYSQLQMIFIEDETRGAYVQFRATPRYDARRIALLLAHIHHCPIVIATDCASATYTHIAKQNNWNSIRPQSSQKKIFIHIVSSFAPSFTEYKKSRTSGVYFSQKLIEAISTSFSTKNPFFLLTARRGASGLSICADCHQTLLCPQCGRALIAQADEGYRCLHCKHTSDVFTTCPKCGSLRFIRRIPGSQTIERVTKSLFPQASILRIDADSERFSPKNITQIQKKCKTADIIIGTPVAVHLLTSTANALSGAGIPDADTFLRWPEYNSEEQAFHLFLRVKNAITAQSSLVIQTRSSDHRVIKALTSSKNIERFIVDLLEEREILSYPPFARLLTITGMHRDEKTLLRQWKNIHNLLEKELPTHTHLSPSFIPIREKRKGYYFRRILAKIPLSYDTPLPKSILQTIKKLPVNWSAEADPQNIL